jgi:hypothetical protein
VKYSWLHRFSCVCLLLLSACKARDATSNDAAAGTETARAAARSGTSCSSNAEQCNGRDDDCDGIVDEDVEDACSFDNASGRCVSGHCVLTGCRDGYLNCDNASANGCERVAGEGACADCAQRCEAPDAASDAQTTPELAADSQAALDASAATEQPPPDAALPDADAGMESACAAQVERCDGLDNDCDGLVDEAGACQACLDLHISGQTADCDRCACQQCSEQVARCTAHDTSTWSMRCVDLLQCYGTASLAGRCPNGDCYAQGNGPCASEAHTAALGDGMPTCAQSPITTPCGAAAAVRETCLLTTCASACKL